MGSLLGLEFWGDRRVRICFLLGLLLAATTAITNIGIIAFDDYHDIVVRVIPAQRQSLSNTVHFAGLRSPIPPLTLVAISNLAYSFGIDSPTGQFRLVLLAIALFCFLLNTTFGAKHFSDSPARQFIAVFLLGFYFVCPLFFSRAMIETLSAPFITVSAFFACRYFSRSQVGDLLIALVLLILASMYRFQSGILALVLFGLIFMLRKPKHLIPFLVVGLLGFLLTGYIDYLLRGSFHASLLANINYNLNASSSHGVTPFYTFLLLFIGLTVPPAFLSRYRKFEWKKEYAYLLPTLLYFSLFVIVHSLVPHKEERFMIPVLPLFLILLVPLAHHIWLVEKGKWRVGYFLVLNSTLLLLTAFSVPQKNVVDLAMYINSRPSIKTLVGVEGSLMVFPYAYIKHPVSMDGLAISPFGQKKQFDCSNGIVLSPSIRSKIPGFTDRFDFIQSFHPGPLEALIVRLNPKRNSRRGTLELYSPKGCAISG